MVCRAVIKTQTLGESLFVKLPVEVSKKDHSNGGEVDRVQVECLQ